MRRTHLSRAYQQPSSARNIRAGRRGVGTGSHTVSARAAPVLDARGHHGLNRCVKHPAFFFMVLHPPVLGEGF